MKTAASTAALFAMTLIAADTAVAQSCTGPFRQCAVEIQATCSIDPDGKQRFTFTDALGNWRRWERCVGRIFEANGQKNPYNLPIGSPHAGQSPAGSGTLTVPYTEMLFPHNDGRD